MSRLNNFVNYVTDKINDFLDWFANRRVASNAVGPQPQTPDQLALIEIAEKMGYQPANATDARAQARAGASNIALLLEGIKKTGIASATLARAQGIYDFLVAFVLVKEGRDAEVSSRDNEINRLKGVITARDARITELEGQVNTLTTNLSNAVKEKVKAESDNVVAETKAFETDNLATLLDRLVRQGRKDKKAILLSKAKPEDTAGALVYVVTAVRKVIESPGSFPAKSGARACLMDAVIYGYPFIEGVALDEKQHPPAWDYKAWPENLPPPPRPEPAPRDNDRGRGSRRDRNPDDRSNA